MYNNATIKSRELFITIHTAEKLSGHPVSLCSFNKRFEEFKRFRILSNIEIPPNESKSSQKNHN